MNLADQVRNEILSLQEALITSNPGMPTMLREIHKQLRQDSSVVTLLSPEEIGVVFQGLMKQTNTTIAAKAVKSKSSKSLKNISVGDI